MRPDVLSGYPKHTGGNQDHYRYHNTDSQKQDFAQTEGFHECSCSIDYPSIHKVVFNSKKKFTLIDQWLFYASGNPPVTQNPYLHRDLTSRL